MRIVLASASPRRKELLRVMGIENFEVIAAEGEEPAFKVPSQSERVKNIALWKARNVAARAGEDALIIAADTLVFSETGAMGKPHGTEDAVRMLRELSGAEHSVATGVAVLYRGEERCAAEVTKVRFAELSEAEIQAYVSTGEPMDKAGAYGIQGRGSLLVRGIDGDYFNVMGLPIRRLYEMLCEFGVKLL